MSSNHKVISCIAQHRERIGLTQAKLAALIGVTTNTIQNWESGKSGLDHIEKLIKLCTILGCDLTELIEYIPSTEPEGPKPGDFSIEDLQNLRERWSTSKRATSSKENNKKSPLINNQNPNS